MKTTILILLLISTLFPYIDTAIAAQTGEPIHELEAAFDGCHIKFKNTMKGKLRPMTVGYDKSGYFTAIKKQNPTDIIDIAISFGCEHKTEAETFKEFEVSREDGRWKILPSRYDPNNIRNANIYSLDKNKKIGFAITEDQTTGDPEERNRSLIFCITNHEQMLCGSSEVIARVADPKTSVLPEVLEMLKSIEFLDPVEGAFTRP